MNKYYQIMKRKKETSKMPLLISEETMIVLKLNIMKLKKHLAPIKVAIIPLKKNNEQIMAKCHEIKQNLLKLGIGRVALENTGNIGKAYRRHDEVGTPLCLTVDFETIENQPESVTLRDRDTMEQIRVNTADLKDYLRNYFAE